MTRRLSVELPCELKALSRCAAGIREQLASEGLEARILHAVDVVIEELVSNAIRHGGLDASSPPIRITIDLKPAELRLDISDAGRPFDPTAAVTRRAGTDLSSEPVGGLGLGMVRRAVSQLHWTRLADRNHTTAVISR